uniref:HNH endonuclease n=1 Tax=Marseillevirus LCMAC101 TaxID=2506602 RepID=A0A481YUK9_9VIRU|nr:MAG: HNH endonuclease [Marseillevirus LCMAC101]
MADEEWKNLPVIRGRSFSKYEVSSMGQIRNKKSKYIFSSKPFGGYIRNKFLDDEGISKNIYVHIIVARAFIGEPKSSDLTVDHINRKPTDNRVVNLRWATKEQQAANSDKSNSGCKGQPVIQYTMDMEEIKRWVNITTAANELKIDKGNISKVCKGSYDHAGGFKWAYERQDLDGEIWKNYEPMDIQVSNMGRIKSLHITYGSKTGNYLTYGEPQKRVHVMVAEVFLPNPENKPEVNHKDKNGINNKLENLEWATRSEQMIHSHQSNSNPDRYSNARAVKQYDLEGNFICEYESIKEASKYAGCLKTSISQVCSGLSKSTKKFVFKYANEDAPNQSVAKYPNKVDRIDKNGNVIKTYDSVRVAALALGISYNSIYEILRGDRKETRGGHSFRYD